MAKKNTKVKEQDIAPPDGPAVDVVEEQSEAPAKRKRNRTVAPEVAAARAEVQEAQERAKAILRESRAAKRAAKDDALWERLGKEEARLLGLIEAFQGKLAAVRERIAKLEG